MRNVYQVTSQCGLNASNGLCGEVVATSEPFGNLRVSLMEHSGKVFLAEPPFLSESHSVALLFQTTSQTQLSVRLELLQGNHGKVYSVP